MLRNALCCFSLNYTILGALHFYFEHFSLYTCTFSLCSFSLNIGFLLPWHIWRNSVHFILSGSAVFLNPSSPCHSTPHCLLPVAIVFASCDVVLLQYYHLALFNSDCSVVSLSICVISHPCFHHLSSFFHHSPLTILWTSFFLSIHNDMSQFWRGPLRASSLMNVSATWIFHAPCSCLHNDSASSKAHWLKFYFILLDVFLFCLFAKDGVCLSA